MWARILENPIREISQVDFTAADAAFDAAKFLVFVLALTLAVEIPIDVAFTQIRIQEPAVLLALVISDAISILMIGPLLYFPAKLVFGRGTFSACFFTGAYLSAFWPVATLFDYVLWSDKWARGIILSGLDLSKLLTPGPEDEHMLISAFLLCTGLVIWLLVKALPVVKSLHSIGAVRALIAIGIGYLAYAGLQLQIFGPMLEGLNSRK